MPVRETLPPALFRFRGEHVHAGKNPVFPYVLFKLHNAVAGCVDGKVAAKADAVSRMHLGTELTHNDIAGKNTLPAEALHASALSRAIAAIP